MLTHADKGFEFFILDSHIFHRIQQRDTIREASMYFQNTLPHRLPRLFLAEVLRKKYSNMTDSFDRGQQNGNNERDAFLSGCTRLNPARGGGNATTILCGYAAYGAI